MHQKYLSVEAGVLENNHLYVVDIDTWLLLDYDLVHGNCDCIADLQFDYDRCKLCWVERILHIGTSFYIIIRNYKGILEIDERKKVIYYELYSQIGNDDLFFYMDACVINDCLYLLPGTLGGDILVFDIKEHRFINQISMMTLFDRGMKECKDANIWSYLHNDEDTKVRFSAEGSNKLFSLDLDNMVLEETITYNNAEFLYACGSFDTPILLEGKSHRLYRYKDYGISLLGNEEYCNKECNCYSYMLSFCTNGKIYVVPESEDCVEIICGNNHEKIVFPNELKLIYEVRNYNGKFSCLLQDCQKAYFLPFSANGMVIFDKHRNESYFINMTIPDSFLRARELRKNIVKESDDVALEELIIYTCIATERHVIRDTIKRSEEA